MNYVQAVNLLDMRRAGKDMPVDLVNQALELTGDLEDDLIAEIQQEKDTNNKNLHIT
jgi:hypothetical protein